MCASRFLYITLLFVVSIGGYYAYAQSTSSQQYVIETVHVFSEKISSEGWKNSDQIGIQNLSDVSLYQEFNNFNSAYIDVRKHREKVNKAEEEVVQDSSVEDSLESEASLTGTSTPSAENNDVENFEEIITENNTEKTVVIPDIEDLQTEAVEEVQQEQESVASIEKVTGMFSLVFATVRELFPFAQEVTTTTTPESLVKEFVNEVVMNTATSSEESAKDVGLLDVQTDPVVVDGATSTEDIVDSATSTDEVVTTDEIDANESATSTPPLLPTEVVKEDVKDKKIEYVEIEPCANECVPYVITMSDFGLPIFDQTLRLGGGQMRVSFAAKRKSTRDEMQKLSLNYSFDDGENWKSGGIVLIDDEASNSINGGFYLFSIPELTTPEDLDALSIEIRYQDDPRALEGIYLESAWLELFTVKTPDVRLLDAAELLADNGFDPDLLSGDRLTLADGSKISFDHTDENNGETLIIKSDQSDYSGLSESTMYFSVSNTSKKADTFSLKTYFPDGVGEVVALEEWNQNKEKKVVIPEYRPYSYYCDAGWEATSKAPVDSLEAISKLLFPEVANGDVSEDDGQLDIEPSADGAALDEVVANENQIEDTEVEISIDTSSTTQEVVTQEIENDTPVESEGDTPANEQPTSVQEVIDEIASTTAFENADTSYPFTQATNVTYSPDANAEAVVTEAIELENNYACRDTNIVRTCDAIEGDNTSCLINNVKVQEHELIRYDGGWEGSVVTSGDDTKKKGLFAKAMNFLGFGPDTKSVPSKFEVRSHSKNTYQIEPGETKYFKMEISFPMFSEGEFWIEAIGEREYGLLDPFWSSQWQYRIPVLVDNTDGTTALTEQQVYLQLDSAMSDFWGNVNADGSDIRFVQESTAGNLYAASSSQFNNALGVSWVDRIALTIPASSVSAGVADFPVFVDLSTLGSTFWSGVASDGSDIRITQSDGATELPVDIVEINAVAQTGEMHFLANSLSAASDTNFHIYFNNPTASAYASTSPLGSQAVWANYEAVYHFSDDPTAISNIIDDETGNTQDLIVEGAALATTTGAMGTALDLTGTTVGILRDTGNDWAWASGDDLVSTGLYYQTVVSAEAIWQWGTTANPNWATYLPWYANAAPTGRGYLYFGRNTWTEWARDTSVWHHFTTIAPATIGDFHGIYDNSIIEHSSTQNIADPSNLGGLQIGRWTTTGSYNGLIDELRFARNDDLYTSGWVATEYLNQTDPTTFYATSTSVLVGGGSVEGWFSTSWNNRQKISIGAQPSSLTDFPVYVDLSTLGADFFTAVASDGRDIRILKNDNKSEVPFELVDIDTGAKTGELYFKADLGTNDVSDFYIYFDNSDATAYARGDAYGSNNVWTNSFQAVYHLQEDAVGVGNLNIYKDSTANEYDGDDENTSNSKVGKLGPGQEFGDDQNDHLSLPKQVMDGLTDATVSWWHNTTIAGAQSIVSAASGSGGSSNEYLDYFASPAAFYMYNENLNNAFGITAMNDGVWHAFSSVRNAGTSEVFFYVDGTGDTENPDTLVADTINVASGGLIVGQDQDSVGGGFNSAQNFEGQLDELRISDVVRDPQWIASGYNNQESPSTFYSTSSVDTLQATIFTELDFWVQHFSTSTDEADIWVQVDSIPAGEQATIWMYYGNSGATSASDEFAPFTYDSLTDTYYVVHGDTSADITLYSLIDNNEVTVDGGAVTSLDAGESMTISGYASSSVIASLGPITSRQSSGEGEPVIPISFAARTHISLTERNAEEFHIYSPFNTASVSVYNGSSGVAGDTGIITAGAVDILNVDITAGTNAGIIESDEPILLYNEGGNNDSVVSYPPTTEDLFGFHSNNWFISTADISTNYDVYCENGASATGETVTRGALNGDDICTQVADAGPNSALRITNATDPVAALQQADSDGNESTIFLPEREFGTEYYIPTASDYVAAICSPRFGTTTLEIYAAGSGTPTETGTCTPTADSPDSIRFANGGSGDTLAYGAGSRIVSSNGVPFYVIYDDEPSAGDETNTWSAVQGRKYHDGDLGYSIGEQEVANDAQYEQLSFTWYQNGDVNTPTTTWETSVGEYVSEGEAITGGGAVDTGDVLRLRMNLLTSNATGTADATAFKLQYIQAESGQCSIATSWADLGAIGSTTAAFRGYNNDSVSDGAVLATSTLASTTDLMTYEERNLSNFLPSDLEIGDVAEWDWVIETNDVQVNTNYCFRMVRAGGTELVTYTTYPEVETVGPPVTPTPFLHFDNERTAVFESVLEFSATDIAGDEINYEIEIDDDLDFSSVAVNRNSVSNFLEFENLVTPSDKAPFNSGARIRFTSPTTLIASTTYWWRVRASDPSGSATSSAWSVPQSFTTDGSVSVSEWYQTTGHQFTTNTLSGLSTTTTQVSVSSNPGKMTGTAIDFDDGAVGNAWGEVLWNDTETSGEITYQVEFLQNGSWSLVPDSLITGNSAGTSTSPINILELDTGTYNEIRLVANFSGATLSVQDWTVVWGLRVETPVLGDLFDNEKTVNTLPIFDFVSSDPQGDDLEYEITWSTDYNFTTASTTHNSGTDVGFTNQSNGADLKPFTSGDTITYTTQAGEAFVNGTTYWWKARAKDPAGGDAWSPWSEADSFTVDTALTVSTWFQTTEDQFTQGDLVGLVATSSGGVVMVEDIGEYGTVTLTDNNWTTVTTANTYRSMVVVVSPEYLVNNTNGRSPRIRNKTTNTFEVKVDSYTDNFVGSTVADYVVMEAGTWSIEDGAGGTQVVAGTESLVSNDLIRAYATGYTPGPEITFSPVFSATPAVFATISSANDTSWVMTHTDGCTAIGTEVPTNRMCVSMAESTMVVADHDPEDIDYIAFGRVDGTNDGTDFKVLNSPDAITGNAVAVSYPTAFATTPATVLAYNNAEDGGDGGMGSVTTAGTHNASQTVVQITEFGPTADGHTTEIVSIVAFEDASGIIKRDNSSGTLTGEIYGEDIIFTDGAGPKFENFSFIDSTPGASDIVYQLQYQVSEGVYALIPDTDIVGNSSGTSLSPIDLTGVDIDTYGIIRPLATFTCSAGICPELQEWKVEWSEGVDMSGTLKEYDRSTNVAAGTIRAAVNGVLLGGTGTVVSGVWTLNNVTAFAGDIVTVWVDGAIEAEEAVTVFVYDGLGDINSVALYEQHVSIDSGEKGTLTNALMSVYDNSISGDEDIFFDVDALNNLTVCAVGTCMDANLYIAPGQTYIAATSSATTIVTHDFVNEGTVELDANIFEVSGSWENNATSSTDTSTLIMTASTTDESINSTESPLNFHNVTFGSGSGTSTYSISAPLDLSGNLSIISGTFDRATHDITVAGNVNTGLLGSWSGVGTTTFDGGSSATWTDSHASTSVQNIGNVVVDGTSKIVTIGSDVSAYDITIGSNDTLSAGGSNTIFVHGDWTNTGTFNSVTSNIEFVNDDRTYPPIVPGSSDWYSDTNFVDRIPVVIDSGEVPATQTDFPVYVDLSTLGDDFWDSVQTDGDDIRITQSDGQTELPVEVVSIDTSAKTGELHFLANTVSGAVDTTFYLYHNNPGASGYAVGAVYGRNNVWSGYEAVYHFNDDITVTGSIALDSSGSGKDLAVITEGLATSTGQIGLASDFNGSTGIMTDADWSWTAGDIHVASGWYKMSAASTEGLWSWGTGSTFTYLPWYTGTTGYHRFGSSAGGTSHSFSPRSTTQWQHFTTIAPTSTGQLMYVYENTIERDSTPLQVDNPSNGPLQIGRYTTVGSIDAEFDELRFATSTRDTDWIETEYSNQKAPEFFYSTSSVETYIPNIVLDEATHAITAGGSNFYDLTFNDATTSPAFTDPSVIAAGDFVILKGVINMPTGKMTIGGSFLNSGVFMHNNSEIEFDGSGAYSIMLGGTAYLNSLYDVTFDGSGSWVFTDTSATTSNNFVIDAGTVTLPGGVLTIGAALTTNGGGFAHNGGSVGFLPNGNQTVTTNGSSFNNVQFGDGTALAWYDIAWGYRTEVSILAGTVSETLTDFPVYVNLGGFDDSFWDFVDEDGADIRVTKLNGVTEIPVDVVEIDTITKTGELHFLADSISPSATTTFYVYFENTSAVSPDPASAYGSQEVWVDYEAVYHFNDGIALVTDETFNGRDLVGSVGTAATTTGLLGEAIDMTTSSVRLDTTGWTWTSGEDLISSGLYFMDAVDNGALWQFGAGSGSNNGTYLSFLPWYSGTQTGYHQFGYTSLAAYNFVRDNTVWHHFTTIGRAADGSTNEIYDQNILRDSWNQITSSANPSNTDLRIGCYQNTTCTNIQIDELRIATSTPSSGRMTAEYDNLTDVAHFYATSTAAVRIDSVATYTLDETTTDADGDVLVIGTRLVAPSVNLTVGGSFTATDAVFDANNATTTLDSNAGVETVSVEDNTFYNLSFNNAGGDWTTVADIIVENNMSLVSGTQFTQATGTIITVQGTFSNTMGGATTWDGSTLVLTGGDYTVTERLATGDTYATMEVSSDSDIVIWNSSISTSTIQSGSSIYMPDFTGTDGLLRIYGDYERLSGDEYWSYATDFDGTDLTGGDERTVTVEVENASQLVFESGTTLHVNGISGATTTVQELFGLYEVTLDGATLDMQFAQMKGMGVDGLNLTNASTVSSLTDTKFEVSSGRSGLTADVSTINLQPSSEFQRVYFATTTATTFYDLAWTKQVIVSVKADAITTTLSNFPVYVDLSTLGADFWAGVQSDGRDIRVTTSGADELPVDLVWIDSVAQTGELHFLAPTLSASKDSVFYVHFDNAAATAYAIDATYGQEAVWTSYEAVYHFNDGVAEAKDATGYSRDLVTTTGTAATTTGLLGEAIDTTTSSVLMQNTGWAWTAGDDLISSGLYFMTAVDTGALWQFGAGGGSNNGTYLAFMPNYDSTFRGRHFFGITSGSDYIVAGYDNSIWHHFTTIGRAADGAINEIYEDNTLRDTVTQITTSQNPTNIGLRIGCYQTTTCGDIQVDELRFATTTPSNARMNAEYTNLTNTSTFYATSSEATTIFNVTADGIPATFWLFSGGSGDLYGEAFDNDEGDPGSIQWDDSDYTITISGVVYEDDGVTPAGAPVCNGSTEVVKVVIDAGASFTTACSPLDGSYTVTGISYNGEPKITTYVDADATAPQVNVSISDEQTGSGIVAANTITITRPEVIDNSVLVAIIGKDDDPVITPPVGWISVDSLGNTAGDDLITGMWYKVVTDAGTEPLTYNFATVDNGEGYSYWAGALLNVDTVTPVDVASTWVKYQNDFTPEASSITTVTNGALVLAAWYAYFDDDVTVPFSQWNVQAEDIVSGENSSLSVVAQVQSVAGATNNVEVFNVAEARESHAGQFAFRPAGSPTATGTLIAVAVTQTPLGAASSPYKAIEQRGQKTGFINVAAGANLVVDAPVMENGDVLIAIIGKDDFYSMSAPAGWTAADTFTAAAGSRSYSGIWYKVITDAGSEPASYNWINNDTGTEEHMYWVGSFKNVDTTNVFDITPDWTNVQNTSSPIAPSITTVTPGAYVLAAWVVLYDNTMIMPGNPWLTLAEDLNVSTRAMSVVGQKFVTAGATGDVTITGGSTDDVNVGQFALRPAALSVASSIDDMDLYGNRVIVRHEDTAPITIADLTMFDNSNDSDIPYTASTGAPDTLTVLSGSGLMVWDSKEFIPGGVVDLQGAGAAASDGSFLLGNNSTYTAVGTDALTVGGSFYVETGATYTGTSSKVTFTATSTGQQIGSAASSTITFYDMEFAGAGGGWAVQTPVVSDTGILVSSGIVSGIGSITVETGSFSGAGIVDMAGGTTLIKRTNILGGAEAWSFNNLTLGDGSNADTTAPVGSATTTVRGTLTIAASHFLDAGSSVWDLTGSGTVFTETGTFLEDTSLVQYSGTAENILKTSYYDLYIDAATGTVSVIAPGVSLSVLNDLVVGRHATSTLDLSLNNPTLAVAGDIYIGTKGTLIASNSNTLEAHGSWANDGVFTSNGGEVEFKATAGTETIAVGNSSFYDLSLTGTGLFDITENATSTNDMIIGDFTSSTLDSGVSLAVGGTFVNPGFASTWTGSTLYLYGGQAYVINAKGQSDDYATLIVGTSTQPRVWDSSFATTTIGTAASLYSMDHNDIAGDLYIFGDYVNSSYNDYWDYARDWDGADLTGSERQADVYITGAGGAKYLGGSLSVVGSSTASTTIQNQGSGIYELYVGSTASTSWQYATPRNLTSDGIIFTGNAVVDTFDNLDLLAEINAAQVLTVSGTVIDTNPAKNFDLNIFNFDGGVVGALNVTATGTSVSSWRFTNHSGNLDGEALDNDGGDPGEIVWIDSAALITIAGTVYSDEGTTPGAFCDGVTNNITIMVAGLTAYNTTCDGVTGAYSISNIGFGPSDAIVVYIDGEVEKGVAITVDPISNIFNMDVYENRVIVRHESTDQIRIADLAVWDSVDDADIPYTAVDAGTDTLTLPANTKLIVWASKEFAPAGNVNLSGGGAGAAYDGTLELYTNAKWTSIGTEEHSIGGSFISGAGASFDAAFSTTTFTTSGAGRTVDINEDTFHNLAFTGSGSWTISDDTLDTQNLIISGGTLTLPTATTTITGVFDATGGSFVHNGTMLELDGSDAGMVVAFDGSDVAELLFNGSGSWDMTDTNATATASVAITSGTVSLPSGTFAIDGNFRNVGGLVTHNTSELILDGVGASTLFANGSDLSSVTYIGSGDLTMVDNSLTLAGSLIVNSGTVVVASGTLAIGGSLDATGGVLTHSSGTILFNSSDVGETVSPGANNFYNVVFGSASGGWTIASNATATRNFTLSAASSFIQQSGTTLRVEGVFSNVVGGVATTWTGTTLVLDSGTVYEINTKGSAGDTYNILTVPAGTDISMWNSDAGTTNVTATSSVYSQDHSAIDGHLDIFGAYTIATSSEYWSYATDFDGAALGGSSRQVTVSFATTSSSSITMTGAALEIIGTAAATTSMQSAGIGDYAMNVSGGTFNASYYDFTDQDLAGLSFSGTPTITSLSNGAFTQSKDNAVSITLKSVALNNNASLITTGTSFVNGGFAGGVNVSLDATTTSSWTFTGHSGSLSGEAFDIDGSDACSSIRWDDSDCLLTEQTHYRWRNDDGGEGAIDSTWYDTNWGVRKRVRVVNVDTTSYTDVAVKMDVAYDADMQTDFDDLRFTDNSGTTSIAYWIEKYSVGVSAEVWVKVPSLASESTTEVFMYYDHTTATTTSSSTLTFAVADDFDDGNISEYTGDTSLFTAGGSFAYGGGFGLDTTGFEGSRATDGIFRSDLTVSQGEIIRYRQYIDTGVGSSDEACTLFGVQNPGTDNLNYAVCLEQFGVDRMSLVKDAESTDTYGGVTVLATSTVSFSTGWYSVEIDWQTDDTIDVTLFDASGAIAATTTVTDGTYTSGGIGVTYWGFNGGWDSFTSQNRTDTTPDAYFGAEQTKGGATWAAAQDTPIGGFTFGDTIRLRMAIENSGLAIVNQKFKLEFAPKLTAPSCEAVSSGDFAEVPNVAGCGGSAVCMTASTTIADGGATTDHLLVGALDFVAGETVTDPGNKTANINVDQGEYTELEYALNLTVNAVNDAYCFRTTNDGALLDSYASIAELTLAFDPVMDTVSFNGGQDVVLLPATTTRVYATTTVSDFNGYADLASASSTFYTTVATAACTADDNDCYITSTSGQCSFSECSGNSCVLSCYADMQFHTNPTDALPGVFWVAFLEAQDTAGGYTLNSSPNIDVLTLQAMGVDNAIGYGTVDLNSDTGTFNPSTTLINLGNTAINIEIAGTDMTDGAVSVIDVNYQKYATSTFTYTSCTFCSLLSVVGNAVDVDLPKPTAQTPAIEDLIYWGIHVPIGTNSAPHTGYNTFYSVYDGP